MPVASTLPGTVGPNARRTSCSRCSTAVWVELLLEETTSDLSNQELICLDCALADPKIGSDVREIWDYTYKTSRPQREN